MVERSDETSDRQGEHPSAARGYSVGHVVGGALGMTIGSVGAMSRFVRHRMPGKQRGRAIDAVHVPTPGVPADIEHHHDVNTPPEPGQVVIRCIDYEADHARSYPVDDLAAFLKSPQPEAPQVRWLNIDGLHPYVIHQLQCAYGFHPIAAEDVLHVPQRPTVEPYQDSLFVISRMLQLQGEVLVSEQISLFLIGRTVITFQEAPGDVFDPIRKRLAAPEAPIRRDDPSYLLYALLDAMVDHGFPILERYSDELENLENLVVDSPDPKLLHRIHQTRRELGMLRRVIWPMRQVVSRLSTEDFEGISHKARTYLRDVNEHAIQLVEIVETLREIAGSLTELHMSAVSNRMNQIMKVLTIMATLFIPVTFLAGVYGMNFEFMPELKWPYGYLFFWVVVIVLMAVLLGLFRRRGWIGEK